MTLPGFKEHETDILALAYYHLKVKDSDNVDWDAMKEYLKLPTVAAAKMRVRRAMEKTLEKDGEAAAGAEEGKGKKKAASIKGIPAKKGMAKKVETPSKRKKVESEGEESEGDAGAVGEEEEEDA